MSVDTDKGIENSISSNNKGMEIEYVIALMLFLIGLCTWIIDIFTLEHGTLFNVITLVALLSSSGVLILALDKHEKYFDKTRASHFWYMGLICVMGFIIGACISRVLGWA